MHAEVEVFRVSIGRSDAGYKGGGLLSLNCLLFFLGRADCQELFQETISRREKALTSTEGMSRFESYPLSVALVNVTRFVASLFALISNDGMAGKKTNLNDSGTLSEFYPLISDDDDDGEFFHKIVADCMLILDGEWKRRNASYMEFPQVFDDVKEMVKTELRTRVMQLQSQHQH